MGSRMLRRWVVFPLRSEKTINDRLDVVEYFFRQPEFRDLLDEQLHRIGDLERIVSKVAVGRVTPREMVQMKVALQAIKPIKSECEHTDNEVLKRIGEQINLCEALRQRIDLDRYCSDTVGRPTLQDIMSELDRPGRDPRGVAHVFAFDPNIRTIDDLTEGMVLPGVVTNITQFGCFVDLGIKVKGLIHISQMAQRRVKYPAEVVHLRQQVRVRVLSIDVERGRIGLSLRGVE